MKTFITLLALVVATGYSQAQWNNTVTGTDGYFKIRFTSTNVGYVLRNAGVNTQLLKTINAAGAWSLTTPIIGHTIHDFHFIDDNIGFVAVDSGGVTSGEIKVYKTINGGTSWTEISSLVAVQAYSPKIYFVDAMHGTLTETYGRIWHTTDGGINWNSQMFNTEIYNDIEFPTPAVGYIGCWDGTFNYQGILFKTTDSGSTWNIHHVFPNLNTAIDRISFVDDNNGFVSTVSYMLMKTNNGGTVWDTLGYMKQNGIDVEDIFFTSMTVGYAVDSYGNIYKTTNGAVTWQVDFPDDSVGTTLNYIIVNGNVGYATGYNGHVLKKGNMNSIHEIQPDLKMKIYPNPSNDGVFQVLFNETNVFEVSVFNTSGQEVMRQSEFNGGMLNLSALQSGLYYV
ncbi:MAG: YCF48-related protein, partial [Flavobacteriales bacterium]